MLPGGFAEHLGNGRTGRSSLSQTLVGTLVPVEVFTPGEVKTSLQGSSPEAPAPRHRAHSKAGTVVLLGLLGATQLGLTCHLQNAVSGHVIEGVAHAQCRVLASHGCC